MSTKETLLKHVEIAKTVGELADKLEDLIYSFAPPELRKHKKSIEGMLFTTAHILMDSAVARLTGEEFKEFLDSHGEGDSEMAKGLDEMLASFAKDDEDEGSIH